MSSNLIRKEKKSYRQLERDYSALTKDANILRTRTKDNFHIAFLLAVRLRDVAQEDPIFYSPLIGEEFLKSIDAEVKRRHEVPVEAPVEAPVASPSEEHPAECHEECCEKKD